MEKTEKLRRKLNIFLRSSATSLSPREIINPSLPPCPPCHLQTLPDWLSCKGLLESLAGGVYPRVSLCSGNMMKPFSFNSVTTGLESHNLRRPFQFGKVVARSSHFIPTSVSSEGRLGISASLTMDPWSLRGRFEQDCYTIMPNLVRLCTQTVNDLLEQDPQARTPPQFWDWFAAECYKAAKTKWGDDFPKLAVSVALAPIEFAIWDLYGQTHNLPWARCVSAEFLGQDDDFSYVVNENPANRVEILHTIGGKDCLLDLDAEKISAVNDGLPETVSEEVRLGRFKWLKPKVTGDFDFDVQRVRMIDLLVAKLQHSGLIGDVGYFFDANGACPDVSWLSRFLATVDACSHGARRSITNFEQPFAMDRTFANDYGVHGLTGYCDFSIDESLVLVGDVQRAKALGYNRLGVKVCKSVTETLRILHEAANHSMSCDMQDLTQIGRGLLVSASVAAWCGLRIESNGGKNVCKAANAFGTHQNQYKGLIEIQDGCFQTGNLTGAGFSAVN